MDEKDFFFQTSVILKLADLVCLVITPEGKYMTSVPEQLQDFLEQIKDEHPVSLSIDPYLI
ncbi:MAG: hypothetical protein LUE27_10195 [Clostridia bacterium]|nr:hypothetical protein [Clostridia bacterium]